jgi:hypothetical protein
VPDQIGAGGVLLGEQLRQVVVPDAQVESASRHRFAMTAHIHTNQVMVLAQRGLAREFGPPCHVARKPVQEHDRISASISSAFTGTPRVISSQPWR